jgi:hypothetical protein
MKVLVRAVISGFGFSLGAALFKKVADRFGLGDEKEKSKEAAPAPQPDPQAVVDKADPALDVTQ